VTSSSAQGNESEASVDRAAEADTWSLHGHPREPLHASSYNFPQLPNPGALCVLSLAPYPPNTADTCAARNLYYTRTSTSLLELI
jgi:hypothetical protein